MKKICLSPLQLKTFERVAEATASVGVATATLDLLKKHSDPLVRAAAATLGPILEEWEVDREREIAEHVTAGGFDEFTVSLSDDVTIIAKDNIGEVLINPEKLLWAHIKIEDRWAAAPLPGHIADDDSRAEGWTWKLNGEHVLPRQERAVKPGDVIEFGGGRITLVP